MIESAATGWILQSSRQKAASGCAKHRPCAENLSAQDWRRALQGSQRRLQTAEVGAGWSMPGVRRADHSRLTGPHQAPALRGQVRSLILGPQQAYLMMLSSRCHRTVSSRSSC